MASREHVDRLRAGAVEWNRWRKDNPLLRPSLRDAGLYEVELSGLDLSNADLRDCGLRGRVLTEVDLTNAVLSNADLSGAELRRCVLRGADLRWARLANAKLQGLDCRNIDAREAYFFEADLSGSDFSNADLRDSYLFRARMQRTKLRSALLRNADCTGADMFAVDLRGADLTGARLESVSFWGEEATADLTGARLRGVTLTDRWGGDAYSGFLELASCDGLEAADFGDADFLSRYLAEAMEHVLGWSQTRNRLPEFVEEVRSRIRALAILDQRTEEPPEELSAVLEVISGELIALLAKHPEKMYEIRPRQFEELVAELLASHGWRVHLTPASRDGGYDIFAVSKDIAGVETSWLIECKKFREDRRVGVGVARALYGVKGRMHVANAMLATTSSFTKGVTKFAQSLYDFSLKDFGGIVEWLNAYRPRSGGKLYIRDDRLIIPQEEGPGVG